MSGIGILVRRMRRVLVFSQPAGLVHMGFLKPRLLRCLGLRPRSIPGDDSSCFAVGADQDVRHGSDGYSTTARAREPASPHGHTTTPSRTGQSRRPARVCDGVKVRSVLSKLCGVTLLAQGPKDPYLRNARDHDDSPRRLDACECDCAKRSPTQAILCWFPRRFGLLSLLPSFPLIGF